MSRRGLLCWPASSQRYSRRSAWTRVCEIGTAAGEFTNQWDRFRLLGNVGADITYEELNPAFEQLMDRMDAARKTSPQLPERYFKEGRAKIEAGDYDFEIDEAKKK